MSNKEIKDLNYVFRKFIDGRPINFGNIHAWLDDNFVYQLNADYEWFAFWRIACDMRLFESGMAKVSKFVIQMNNWFPDAPHACKASEVNRYRRGYLGAKVYKEWNRKEFFDSMMEKKHCKQSLAGYDRLDDLCCKLEAGLHDVLLAA